jgi:hypothetical protein
MIGVVSRKAQNNTHIHTHTHTHTHILYELLHQFCPGESLIGIYDWTHTLFAGIFS